MMAGLGTVHAYGLDQNANKDHCKVWSRCPEHNTNDANHELNNIFKYYEQLFTFDDLVDTYTIFTRKRVTIDGLLFKPNSLKKPVVPEARVLVGTESVKKTVKETTEETGYQTKLASPTLEIVSDMMNEIKDADIVQVQDRNSWFKLISAGLGAVRTHKLDEEKYVRFCYNWSMCAEYADIRSVVNGVNKIIKGAPKQKSNLQTFGELVKIYKDVTGKDFKINNSSDEIIDICPDEVVDTAFEKLMSQKCNNARDLAVYPCGGVFGRSSSISPSIIS